MTLFAIVRRLRGAVVALVLVWAIAPAASQPAQPSPELSRLLDATTSAYKAGAYAEALESGQRALALIVREFGPEHERAGIQTYSLGMIADAAGKLGHAERFYAESVRIRDKVYGIDSAGSAQAMEMLAGIMLKQGRTAEAERLAQRVLKIRSDLVGAQHSFTAGARADLGAVALARGDADAALASYREAVRLLTTQQASQTLARSVADNEIRRLRPAFAGLAHAAWEVGSRPGGNRAAMMGESYAATQQAWSTSAAGAVARMSARLGAGNTDLGQRIRRLQDMSERVLALHDEDMKALARRSELQRADLSYTAALEAFRQASIAQGRDNAPVVNRQKALVQQLQDLLKRCPPGHKAAGCDPSEREREAITRELGVLAQEAGKGSSNLMALNERMQAADRAIAGYEQFTARRKALLDDSQRLETAITSERAAIVRLFPDYVALTEPKPLTIEETQALLQPGEALVTIMPGPTKSFVWAIAKDRAAWSVLDAGTEKLVEHVRELRAGLDPASLFDPDRPADVAVNYDLVRAYELYRLIMGPVAGVLEGKSHLILVPTGPLSSLPFQVLVASPPPATGEPADRLRAADWLIRRHALSVLPSVQSLAALRRLAPQGSPPQPFLGVGDPVLTGPPDNGPQGRGARTASTRPASVYRNGETNLRAVRELVPLPDTADELRTVAGLLGAGSDALLLRERATEAHLKERRLEAYRVVHFATHGLVAGELSGFDEPALVLTPPESATELDDGLLTASEVAGLKLSADWVVLSACNTASGADSGAEALSGLARAFFYAGARGLLVSHWSVDSEAAVRLTTETFKLLSADPGLGRAEAFRRTMLVMIDEGRHPFYWAPFVIIGEGGRSR